jgi:hypothetical protein
MQPKTHAWTRSSKSAPVLHSAGQHEGGGGTLHAHCQVNIVLRENEHAFQSSERLSWALYSEP